MITALTMFAVFYITLLFPGTVGLLAWRVPAFRRWLSGGSVVIRGRLLALIGLGPLAVVLFVGLLFR